MIWCMKKGWLDRSEPIACLNNTINTMYLQLELMVRTSKVGTMSCSCKYVALVVFAKLAAAFLAPTMAPIDDLSHALALPDRLKALEDPTFFF